jgi:hypothetical protein
MLIAELRTMARIVAYAKISWSARNAEDVYPHNCTLREMTYVTHVCEGVSARYIEQRWKEPRKNTRYQRWKLMPMSTYSSTSTKVKSRGFWKKQLIVTGELNIQFVRNLLVDYTNKDTVS